MFKLFIRFVGIFAVGNIITFLYLLLEYYNLRLGFELSIDWIIIFFNYAQIHNVILWYIINFIFCVGITFLLNMKYDWLGRNKTEEMILLEKNSENLVSRSGMTAKKCTFIFRMQDYKEIKLIGTLNEFTILEEGEKYLITRNRWYILDIAFIEGVS